MEYDIAIKIVEAIEGISEEARIYKNYSGRGMYGKITTGVVCNGINVIIPAIISCAHLFVDEEGESIYYDFDEISQDNLGNNVIFY